jgi:ribosomal protein S28E/S33
MTANTQKLVRVLAGPTGPTGTVRGVRILSTFTGPTGTFPVWGQVNATQQATGATGGAKGVTGTFEEVYQVIGATGAAHDIKTVIIPGFTGPA